MRVAASSSTTRMVAGSSVMPPVGPGERNSSPRCWRATDATLTICTARSCSRVARREHVRGRLVGDVGADRDDRAAECVGPHRCNIRCSRPRGAGSAHRMPTLMDRRGNYDSGEDYVLEYGELRFTFNERDFSERVRAGRAASSASSAAGSSDDRARGPRQPRRQRRGPGPRLRPRRARQRLLARARRPRRPLARALAAPARLPLRLARPARQGGRARRRLRRRRRTPSATSSPSATTSRSSSRPSPPGAGSRTPAARRRSD